MIVFIIYFEDEGELGSDESEGKDWDDLEQEAKNGIWQSPRYVVTDWLVIFVHCQLMVQNLTGILRLKIEIRALGRDSQALGRGSQALVKEAGIRGESDCWMVW